MFLTVFHFFSPFYACPSPSPSFLKSDRSDWLLLLLQKSNCVRIAPVALYKRAIVSHLLRLLMTKEGREQCALFHQ